MPTQKYYLDEAKTDEISMSWRGYWKDITVAHNGHVIGGFHDFSHLKQGGRFQLHDGSALNIYWSTSYGDQGLRISHNGRPLRGSGADPEVRLKGVFGIAGFIGILNFVIGAIGEFGDVKFLRDMGAGWPLMVLGTIIFGLGWCVWKFRSTAALVTIIVLIVADVLITVGLSVLENGTPSFGGIALKVFMIIALLKGFSAINDIKDQETIGDRNLSNRNPFQ